MGAALVKARVRSKTLFYQHIKQLYLPTFLHFIPQQPTKMVKKNIDLIIVDTLNYENNYVVTHTTPLLLDYM